MKYKGCEALNMAPIRFHSLQRTSLPVWRERSSFPKPTMRDRPVTCISTFRLEVKRTQLLILKPAPVFFETSSLAVYDLVVHGKIVEGLV